MKFNFWPFRKRKPAFERGYDFGKKWLDDGKPVLVLCKYIHVSGDFGELTPFDRGVEKAIRDYR